MIVSFIYLINMIIERQMPKLCVSLKMTLSVSLQPFAKVYVRRRRKCAAAYAPHQENAPGTVGQALHALLYWAH